ncbi:hypothetical protein TNCV_2604031 [Trichonephila clavipes]|nr:hypothetical protein TNCV_2604031 [Trichonephila clavipes]
MRIPRCWMQEEAMDRRGRLHPPRCTNGHDNRRIVCMTVMDRAALSRTVAQQIQSVTHHWVSSSTIQHRLHQASIVSFTLDWKPQAFAPPMVR